MYIPKSARSVCQNMASHSKLLFSLHMSHAESFSWLIWCTLAWPCQRLVWSDLSPSLSQTDSSTPSTTRPCPWRACEFCRDQLPRGSPGPATPHSPSHRPTVTIVSPPYTVSPPASHTSNYLVCHLVRPGQQISGFATKKSLFPSAVLAGWVTPYICVQPASCTNHTNVAAIQKCILLSLPRRIPVITQHFMYSFFVKITNQQTFV